MLPQWVIGFVLDCCVAFVSYNTHCNLLSNLPVHTSYDILHVYSLQIHLDLESLCSLDYVSTNFGVIVERASHILEMTPPTEVNLWFCLLIYKGQSCRKKTYVSLGGTFSHSGQELIRFLAHGSKVTVTECHWCHVHLINCDWFHYNISIHSRDINTRNRLTRRPDRETDSCIQTTQLLYA